MNDIEPKKEELNERTPQIVVTKSGNRYGIVAIGKFGGGYSIPTTKTLEEAAEILARDSVRFDCGKNKIVITAPNEVRELAGIPTIDQGRPRIGDDELITMKISSDLKKKLQERADAFGISLNELRRRIIVEYLYGDEDPEDVQLPEKLTIEEINGK